MSDHDPLEQVADLFKQILLERREQEASQPVVPRVDAAALRAQLDLQLPDRGRDLTDVAERLRKLVRHTPITSSGSFFNQLFGGREPAALLGETVAAGLNNSMYTYKVGGAQVLVELELIKQMGLRVGFEDADGVFTPGGSLSNLAGMLVARDQKRPSARRRGIRGRMMRVYTSELCHYSVAKAVTMLGIGLDNLVYVAVDERGRMDPAALREAVCADLAHGHQPVMVNATAGTTVLGAFDPIDELADICSDYGLCAGAVHRVPAPLAGFRAWHLADAPGDDGRAWPLPAGRVWTPDLAGDGPGFAPVAVVASLFGRLLASAPGRAALYAVVGLSVV